jgi:hypothetical protein
MAAALGDETLWNVNGCLVKFDQPANFMSLGVVRHTQYNCPSESDPTCGGGGTTPVCFTDSSCHFTGPEQLSGTFVAQVLGLKQGTGCASTPNHGLVQQEAFCTPRRNFTAPKACQGNVMRANSPGYTPSCGGNLSSGTVAINMKAFQPYGLGCGSTICMPELGLTKTVSDNCPGCDLGSIDDFSSSGACGILDLGTTLTLKVQQP